MGPGMRSPASAQPPPTTRRARLPPRVFHIVIIYGQVKCPSSSPFFSTSCKAGEGRCQSKPGCSGRRWRALGAGRDPLHPPLLTQLPFRLTLKSGGWLGFPAMCSSPELRAVCSRTREGTQGLLAGVTESVSSIWAEAEERSHLVSNHLPSLDLLCRVPTSPISGNRIGPECHLNRVAVTFWRHQTLLRSDTP